MKRTYNVKTSNGECCQMKLDDVGLRNVMNCNNVTDVTRVTFFESFKRTMIKTAAKIIAFADWLGQQDETLVECYEKRLKLWV